MAYSEEQKNEIVNKVCDRILRGEPMRDILSDKDMPAASTFLIWVSEDDAKSKQYARAMEIRGELLFQETLDIADNGSNDWMVINDPDNLGYKLNGEHVQRSRVRIDTRKWYLSKLNPKKFGDKIDRKEVQTVNVINLGSGKKSENES